jgi:iron(III) transport system permease protein
MKKISKSKILVGLFLIVFVIYPLVEMLLQVSWGDFGELVTSDNFIEALTNSLLVTSASTIISILLGYFLAYSLNRTNIKHKAILRILLTLPMLIPSISHGLGLINLFGVNGIISRGLGFNIIGPVGIVMGSILYSFPVAFLMLDDGFHYIDTSMYDNAQVLGLNKWQTFKTVTMCYLKKPILSTIFAVFTLAFTDYGVPLAVGGKFLTLPVFLYKEVIGLLDFSRGTMIGLFLLVPAFVSFLFDNFTKDYTSSNGEKEYIVKSSKLKDWVLTIFTYLVLIFIFVIIGSFVYYAFIDNFVLNRELSLVHFEYVVDNGLFEYIFNSILIALVVSIVGTIIAYAAAYITARKKGHFSKLIHIFTILSLAIPGIVLGLSYTISFKNSFIYNTYIILIIVNIVHFIASPYLMAYNALQKVNSNFEAVAKTCNINIFKLIIDVIVPCTKKTIREMFAYFFVNSMVTISAVAFLFNVETMPLSLLINNYESTMMLGEAAIVSLAILIINMFVKGVIYIINRIEHKRSLYGIN